MSKTSNRRRSDAQTTMMSTDIETFPNAVRYLLTRNDLERTRVARVNPDETFKLDRTRALLEALDNPQQDVRMVHVAGTVGKGSTVAMVASMLSGCGYTVGTFTSPHLVDIRERIAINGVSISRSDFTSLIKIVADAAEKAGLEPTFFEVVTAAAFRYFAEQAVDIAVIEVGLGGRLDCTNVITPEVSVITQIDMDHTALLGRTIEEIAREKAGIMKQGIPALTFDQDPKVVAVLREEAESRGALLKVIGEDIEFSRRFNAGNEGGPQSRICVINGESQYMHVAVPLPGEHQALNCGVALAAVDTLRASGFEFEEVPLLAGLAATTVPGRMELVWQQPRILVDGAHNPASLGALMRSVGGHVPYDSMVCVFGCCEDKDVAAMLEKAALGGDKLIFTRARGNPRALDPEELQRQFSEISGKMSQVAATVPEALDLATQAVGRDDLICVTGSFYLVGETKKFLADLERKRAAAAKA
ncbi:MAG: folylpolyglutamate synthase/dihydrofolate synthase family protein [Phycisphaerales bacterium]